MVGQVLNLMKGQHGGTRINELKRHDFFFYFEYEDEDTITSIQDPS